MDLGKGRILGESGGNFGRTGNKTPAGCLHGCGLLPAETPTVIPLLSAVEREVGKFILALFGTKLIHLPPIPYLHHQLKEEG